MNSQEVRDRSNPSRVFVLSPESSTFLTPLESESADPTLANYVNNYKGVNK